MMTLKHKLRVLIIPSWYPSKKDPIAGVFFKEQAEALAQKNIDVFVLYVSVSHRGRNGRILDFYYGWENGVANCIVRLELPIRKTITLQRIEYLLFCICFFLFVRHRPDIIHAHSVLRGGMLARRLGRLLSIPFVITEHNTAFIRGLYTADTIKSISSIYKEAAALIAVSPFFADVLSGLTSIPRNDIKYIPNMVNTDFFTPGRRHCPGEPWRISLACILTAKKRVDLAIDALSLLLLEGIDVVLSVAGSGDLDNELMDKVRDMHMCDRVRFLGSLDRRSMLALYQETDIFISSSDFETFGVTLIEAISCGIPIVSTNSGGPSCIVDDSNGRLVPRGDANALASAIKEILDHYTLYSHQMIRQRCIERFGVARVTDEIISCYQDSLYESRA